MFHLGSQKLHSRFITKRVLFTFTVVALLGGILTVGAVHNRMDIDRMEMEQLIMEKNGEVTKVVSKLLYKTQALAAIVSKNDGKIYNFEQVASALVDDDAILNVLMAPDGVVSAVYPMEGNEGVLGLDFFKEGAGNKEARLAKETGELVFGGPFTLVQGGQALVGRLPVYIDDPHGSRRFWGIVSVTLKYPEVLDGTGLDSLSARDLGFELWRTNPDNGQRQVIASNDYDHKQSARYVEKELDILNAQWYFRLFPVREWYQYPDTWTIAGTALSISLIVAYMVGNIARLRYMQHMLEKQEAASRIAAQTALEASRMKTTFLATVSHEVRTPMNGIIGFIDLAMDDPDMSYATRDYLLNIERSARSLVGLIDNLLDISKIEAGKVEIERIPFTVRKVLDECVSINSPNAAEKGIELYISASEAVQNTVEGDPTKLRQILLNLLVNAIKFTGIGTVELSCRDVEESEIDITFLFSVKDTGIGMTEEQITRVWEPFAQADSSTTRRYGGTGLGLSISKSLVELMGGSLWIESVPGMGSQFSFMLVFGKASLPVAETKPQVSNGKRPVFVGSVLVCEDVAANRELAREHLSRAGMEVELAFNGLEGIHLAKKRMDAGNPFDLILMDIQMPVMDGIEAARLLKEMGCTAPILAMTANVMSGDLDLYREAGMADFIAKPFSGGELRLSLLRYLNPVTWEPGRTRHVPENGMKTVAVHRDLGLKLTDGDEEWYQRLLVRFVDEQADTYDRINAALRKGDFKQARRITHSLKGVSNMIGAARLASAAARVESDLEQQDSSMDEAKRTKQMHLLKSELDAVLSELQPTRNDAVKE